MNFKNLLKRKKDDVNLNISNEPLTDQLNNTTQNPYPHPNQNPYPDPSEQQFKDPMSDYNQSAAYHDSLSPEPYPTQPSYNSQSISQQQPSREFELINAKLDTLKAMLETINSRLTELEKNSKSRW